VTGRLLTAFRSAPAHNQQRPLYARILRLRHVEPGKVLCALFFEGSIVLAMLLAFADLVSWWGVLATPAVVAAMVKLNDVVVGRLPDPHSARRPPRVRPLSEAAAGSAGGVAGDSDVLAGEPDTTVLGIVRVGSEDADTTVPLPPLPASDPGAAPDRR